jgi:hypothetical protein
LIAAWCVGVLVLQLPSILQAYGGLGRVLPLRRGAGVNQKLFLDYARLVAAGTTAQQVCFFIFLYNGYKIFLFKLPLVMYAFILCHIYERSRHSGFPVC